MKKSPNTVVLIMGLCIVCVLCSSLWKSANSYTRVVKMNWGVDLPGKGAKEVFAYSEPGFHGDGIRYHVIEYPVGIETKEMRNAVFQLEKVFNDSSQPTEIQVENVEQWIKKIGVKDDVIPDWRKCKLVYKKQEDNSELYLFRRSETGTVYIVESFI